MELVMDLPDEAAELFRVSPEGFIVERDALVQRLRAEGRDEEATAVKALRKPTTVVWALNQLAAREPQALAVVFEAGRNLRAAQQAALAGKPSGAEDLRVAGAERRDAVARARDAAVAILDESGHRGAGQADTIASALETASTDTAVGAVLASGTLEKAPSSAAGLGFGEPPAMTAPPGGREGKATPPRDTVRRRREREAARTRARNRRAAADRLARQLADARERVTGLERDHAAADAEALAAETEAERAERDLQN
jgi:hypothetical protein